MPELHINRLIVVGPANVGKTTLLHAISKTIRLPQATFKWHSFAEQQPASTVGIDMVSVRQRNQIYYFWDTSGAERFEAINRSLYSKNLVVVVLDARCHDLDDLNRYRNSKNAGTVLVLLHANGHKSFVPPDIPCAYLTSDTNMLQFCNTFLRTCEKMCSLI